MNNEPPGSNPADEPTTSSFAFTTSDARTDSKNDKIDASAALVFSETIGTLPEATARAHNDLHNALAAVEDGNKDPKTRAQAAQQAINAVYRICVLGKKLRETTGAKPPIADSLRSSSGIFHAGITGLLSSGVLNGEAQAIQNRYEAAAKHMETFLETDGASV